MKRMKPPPIRRGEHAPHFDFFLNNGKDYKIGAERDRTADLLVANEALSQLSYSPTNFIWDLFADLSPEAIALPAEHRPHQVGP